jgi:hypothetical protein
MYTADVVFASHAYAASLLSLVALLTAALLVVPVLVVAVVLVALPLAVLVALSTTVQEYDVPGALASMPEPESTKKSTV